MAAVTGRTSSRLDQVVDDIRKSGGKAVAVTADVGREADVIAAAAEVDELGELDVAVYNAAQAVVIHGGAFAVWILLRILTIIFLPIAFLLVIWDIVWFVIWVIGLILALQAGGKRVSFPVVGPMAQQYVPMVEGWAK